MKEEEKKMNEREGGEKEVNQQVGKGRKDEKPKGTQAKGGKRG